MEHPLNKQKRTFRCAPNAAERLTHEVMHSGSGGFDSRPPPRGDNGE
jgi:hypothetical protein